MSFTFTSITEDVKTLEDLTRNTVQYNSIHSHGAKEGTWAWVSPENMNDNDNSVIY